MVIAGRRAYADAVRWVKRSRRRKGPPARFARTAFITAYAAGLFLLGGIGLLAPARFGSLGSRAFADRWSSLALAGVAGACLLYLIARRGWILDLVSGLRDPFRGPLHDDPAFEPAADALSSAPAPFRARFAASWVWGPAVVALLAMIAAAASAYFVVDAILARLQVGWGQPAYAAVFAFTSASLFRVAAPRLVVWGLAAGVHRTATHGYD